MATFVWQCPALRELRIDQIRGLPGFRLIAANLPEKFEILYVSCESRSRGKVIQAIRDLCEERIDLKETRKMLTLDTGTFHKSDFYEEVDPILENSNVRFVFNKH